MPWPRAVRDPISNDMRWTKSAICMSIDMPLLLGAERSVL